MNYDAIRPDDQTIVIEHQATGEQPVHVTPEGVQAGALTGAPVSLRCPVCGGKLSDVRHQNGRYLTHCFACHFEFYLEGEK